MFGYIYKTTNLTNGKIYIGQHRKSVFEPDVYKGSGKLLRAAIRKSGWENFKCELLCECNSQSELNEMERYWIKECGSQNLEVGYNLDSGKGNGPYTRTSSFKEKLSKTNTGKRGVHKGDINKWACPDELAELLASGWELGFHKGTIKHNETTKKKIGDSERGRHYMYKGNVLKMCPRGQEESWLADGWKFGISPLYGPRGYNKLQKEHFYVISYAKECLKKGDSWRNVFNSCIERYPTLSEDVLHQLIDFLNV